MQERRYGLWQGRKVLFIGDSLTAKRIYPEVVKDILGIETFYHCKGGASLKSMVDGDNGIGGDYDNETDASGVLRPLTASDVAGMDLVVLYGGYNNRNLDIGEAGDLYRADGTVAGEISVSIGENIYPLAPRGMIIVNGEKIYLKPVR